MNILQMQFLDISVKVVEQEQIGERWGAGEKAEGAGDQVEVCDSVTHNVQLSVNCWMIS